MKHFWTCKKPLQIEYLCEGLISINMKKINYYNKEDLTFYFYNQVLKQESYSGHGGERRFVGLC